MISQGRVPIGRVRSECISQPDCRFSSLRLPAFIWMNCFYGSWLVWTHYCRLYSLSAISTRHERSVDANHLIVLTVQKGWADPLLLSASRYTIIVFLNDMPLSATKRKLPLSVPKPLWLAIIAQCLQRASRYGCSWPGKAYPLANNTERDRGISQMVPPAAGRFLLCHLNSALWMPSFYFLLVATGLQPPD